MMNARHCFGLVLVLTGSTVPACKEQSPDPTGTSGGSDELLRTAGQTGDEGAIPWSPGGAPQDPICALHPPETLASLDAETALGFSPASILGFAAGTYATHVRWNARPMTFDFTGYSVQVTPGGVDEPLHIALEHDGTPARYRASTSFGVDAGADCRGQIELGVTVELQSESGALDERWKGTLKASDGMEAVVLLQAPTWRGRLPRQPDRDKGHFLNAQEGSLEVIDSSDPGSVLAWVDVVLRLRPGAADGSVNGWVQDSSGGAFVLPQLGDDRDPAGWIGAIGTGFYQNVWAID